MDGTQQLTAAQRSATQQPDLIALCTVMLFMSTLALVLRLWYNHISTSHTWGWDDFFAVITLPFIIGEMAIIFWWIDLGLGKHAATVPPEDLAQSSKIIFMATFFYDCNISLSKFSALFFYNRVFANTQKWFIIALWTVGIMNAGWLISALITTIFQCDPVYAVWSTTPVPDAKCIEQQPWFLGTAIPSMIIDFLILILPLPMLWGLQATVSRRFMVAFVFVCGYSVIVISIGRLVTLALAGDKLLEDITWTTVTYIKWVQLEGPMSLISVCLPNVFGLLRRLHQKGFRGLLPPSRTQSKMIPPTVASNHTNGQFVRMDTYPSRHFADANSDSHNDPDAHSLDGQQYV